VSPNILPRVRIIEPAKDQVVTTNSELRIIAEVTPPPGARLQSVQLLRNGTLHEPLAADGNQTNFQWSVRLNDEGREEFSVVAVADTGSSPPAEALVSVNRKRPASMPRDDAYAERMKKKLYVLAIGVSNYAAARQNGLAYENLPVADADATTVARVFDDLARDIYDKVIPAQLSTVEETAGHSIRQALRHHVTLMKDEQIDRNDAVVLYYAGHASWDEETNQFCLVPSDGNTTELMELLERFCYCGVCKRLLILDTCYSGAALEELVERSSLKDWSADMFASSTAFEPSKEDRRGGHFTRRVVQGLEGGYFWWDESPSSSYSNADRRRTVRTKVLEDFLGDLYDRVELKQKPVIKTTGDSWELTQASFKRYMTRRWVAQGPN
jgi:hypothetical protein